MLVKLYRCLGGLEAPEECYYAQFTEPLSTEMLDRLIWLIGEAKLFPYYEGEFIEVGPRLSVETPFSSNATAICAAMGIPVSRLERSLRYPKGGAAPVIDHLTQEIYPEPLTRFSSPRDPEPVRIVDVLGEGKGALERANSELGLGMDHDDIDYYVSMFTDLERNPSDVELFQLGNGNSEHSRHHFFNAVHTIDGREMPRTLMDIVKAPWKASEGISLTAFHDNSGVIEGTSVQLLSASDPCQPSAFHLRDVVLHLTATAETHNHPTLIAPFPGAETGAGGRIRDSRAVGRGGLTHAGIAGYCVGGLFIDGYAIPGETIGGEQTTQHATPLQILLRGSDGVSDYANKIGEPLILGFTRSFGALIDGRRREFRKPVLYSAGVGRIDNRHVRKHKATPGMNIVRIGGPAYRIGVGGGSASSMIQGTNAAGLDLKSVQRGDPEMENRVNRVIQACAEMGDNNPIESIHDQGAGGPSNVLTELMEPLGGTVDIRKITLGDPTMSVLEIWVAEYQEGYGLLVSPERLTELQSICARERVNCEVLGEITGDGNVTVFDSQDHSLPVDLSIDAILSDVPRKRFSSEMKRIESPALVLPQGITLAEAFKAVLQLPQVGSKGYLVHKADRFVTGLVAQQQCCGPVQVPVANVGITADSYAGLSGVAVAIGEQPIKMLVDPARGARMAVAEMLTNMASARVSALTDITCRANWMFAAKLEGEGARLYAAAVAMSDLMITLGIRTDGGKDSLSMAANVDGVQVVAPGQLVILGYAPVPDITKSVTPDVKGDGLLGLIDFGRSKNRLGGSSLAQAYGQLGGEAPDIENAGKLARAFNAIQECIDKGLITAYHDRSDGGLITTVAEMCIAGNCGANIWCSRNTDPFAELFNEEAGMVFEYQWTALEEVTRVMSKHNVAFEKIGTTTKEGQPFTVLSPESKVLLSQALPELRSWWEATSTQLRLLESNPETARQEAESYESAGAIPYQLSFTPAPTVLRAERPRVVVVREEGTNGDREMAAALYEAGFDPWDVAMSDILEGRITSLHEFKGVIFPGGFSYADVMGSAKGWAGSIRFNPRANELFERFYTRTDTFSLGVCNGCQLMANIGWVPFKGLGEASQPRFTHNTSGRFESRWAAVKVLQSPSIMLSGMEGSVLGINVAHGEGRLVFPDARVIEQVREQKLAALAYVDVRGEATEAYPYNPNGSPEGWTALSSVDGRHLAMMPHPERSFLTWQWAWMPEEWRTTLKASPWLQMFQNARDWC